MSSGDRSACWVRTPMKLVFGEGTLGQAAEGRQEEDRARFFGEYGS